VLRLVEPEQLQYFPGQYLDLTVPGTSESRSFSMANPPTRDGRLEFVIKLYPGGLFSAYLDQRAAAGDRLEVEGPFGTFTLRDSRTSDLVFLAGGAGLAPVLALLRSMAERGIDRKATFYSASEGPATCASSGNWTPWPSGCRGSGTCPRCPTGWMASGRARPGSSPTSSGGARAT
jgi:propane monooxygenase reductase subunit